MEQKEVVLFQFDLAYMYVMVKSQPKANYFKVINGRLSPCCVRCVRRIFMNGEQNCTSLLTVK